MANGTTTYYRHHPLRSRRWLAVAGVLVTAAVPTACASREHRAYGPPTAQTSSQAAGPGVVSSAGQQPVPIASLAKVMTAYLVLRNASEVSVTVTGADVADTARRAAQDESVVD